MRALPPTSLASVQFNNEPALQRQLQQLQTIYRLSGAVTRAASVEEIADVAVDGLIDAIGADRAAVLLYDEDGVMRFMRWRGLSASYRAAVEGHTPWSPDDASARPIAITDAAAEPDLADLRGTIDREGIRALAFIPLLFAGRVLGKFMVYFDQPHEFKEEELQVCQTIADHVSYAIDRSRSEAARRESEARYRQLINLVPVAIYRCEAPSGVITFYNEYAAALWGREPEVGDTDERFCGSHRLWRPDGTPLPHDRTPMAAALREGRSFRNEDVIVERPDGARLHVLVNIDPVRDASGRIVGAINAFHDVSALKHAEAALRDSEQRLRQMIDALPVVIYTTDAEGRVTHSNPATEAFTGRTPALGADRWCVTWKLRHPDGSDMPHDTCPMAIALKEGRALRGVEALAERPDGTRRWFAAWPTPLRDRDGTMVGGINMLVDITERKRHEEQMQTVMAELNHRVKNTLAVVQSLASQTIQRAPDLQAFRESFEHRLRSIAAAHALLTRSEWTGSQLEDIIRNEVDSRLDSHEQRTINGPRVILRPKAALAIHMVIHELATNAAKYGALKSPQGRIRIEWTADRGADGEDEMIRLTWTEQCPHAVPEPTEQGYGSRLIEQLVSYELDGEVERDYRRDGLCCRMTFALDATC